MEKQDLINELAEKISSEILNQPEKIQVDAPLISGGVIDSFSLVDLALMVEDAYGVRIEDYELNADTFDSLDELADLIIQKKP